MVSNWKLNLVLSLFIFMFSCNDSEKSEKDLLLDGSWIIYDIESADESDNFGLIMGIWMLGQVDFESIKFKANGYYEAFNSQGESIISEKYQLKDNELIVENDEGSQALKIKQLDSDKLVLVSSDGITTKLKKK